MLCKFLSRKRKGNAELIRATMLVFYSIVLVVIGVSMKYTKVLKNNIDDTIVSSGLAAVSNNNTNGDDDSANEEEQKETILKISVYEVKPMAPASKDLMLEIPDITIWNDLFNECVAQYVSPVGKYHVVLHDILFNEIRETSLHVVPQIKNDPILGSLITTL